MKYLLDINTLIALAYANHTGHDQTEGWFKDQWGGDYYFCSLLEMGFVRVSLQAKFEPSIQSAVARLGVMKDALDACTITDDLTAQDLPAYVRAPKQVSDGHFLALAHRHDINFVTLDQHIPGAITID